jgi:chromosome segregation ATPase
MLRTYPVFLLVSLTVVSKCAFGQIIYQSPMTNVNVPDPTMKDQMLNLIEESVRTSFLKLSAQLNKRLDDLRIDMNHRDTKLSEEIYNVKETLKREGFTLQSQLSDGNEVSRESHELSVQLTEIEKGLQDVSQKSKTGVKILKEKLDVLENENRMISSKVDATQMIVMSIASGSSLRTNDSDGVFTVDFATKLQQIDDKLNDLNETVHDNCNITVDMVKVVGVLKSEVRTLNSSIDALRVSVSSNSKQNTTQENSLNAQTTKLLQSEQTFSAGLSVLQGSYNLSTSNIKKLNASQRKTSSDMKDHVGIIYSLADSLNATRERFENLENKLNLNLTNFQIEIQSFWNEKLDKNNAEIRTAVTGLESNLRLLQESKEKAGMKMRNFDAKLSSFQSQYWKEMDSIRDSLNSTVEDYKSLADLTETSSASYESSITALNISLNQFMGQFSSVNASIAKLDQDSSTYNAILENSKFEINNITTTVLDLQKRQKQINATGNIFQIKD